MAPDLSSAHVLVVDDEEDVLVAARLLLKRHFASVQTIPVPSRLPDLARDGAFDVLLLDMNFTIDVDDGAEGLKWLSEVFAACYSLCTCYLAHCDTAHRHSSYCQRDQHCGYADDVTWIVYGARSRNTNHKYHVPVRCRTFHARRPSQAAVVSKDVAVMAKMNA
jgi:hypothetical protein